MEYDTFARPDQSGWGTATNGDTWSIQSGDGTLSIASNEGVVTGGTSPTYVQLGTYKSAKNEALVRTSVTASGTSSAISGIMLRATNPATNTRYMFMINYVPSSVSSLQIFGGGISLSSNFTMSPNTFYWIRAHADESELSMKVWADGQTEPAIPNLVTTSFGITDAGWFGLLAKTVDSGSSVQFDHFFECSDD